MRCEGSLSHIEINVSNLKNTSVFWRWFLEELGYEEFQNWENGISWKLGDTYIVFVQTQEKYCGQEFHRCQTGLNHLAFKAESKRDVDEMATKLLDRHVDILYKDRYPHAGGPASYAVFFEDPDRLKVEFVFYEE